VAIRTNNMLNGFLLLGYSPASSERKALQSVGGQFGRLLNEAEEYDLLNQQARSMRALQDVMLSLSATLNPSDLLDNVLDKLEMVVPFDLAGIAIYDEEGLKVHASRGDRSKLEYLQLSGDDPDRATKMIFSLIEQESPVLLRGDDLENAFDAIGPDPNFASWIGVPISWAGDRLGYLFLASKLAMEANHLEISISFARQLAIALQNARLLQGSKARAEQLQLVNDIGRYAISILDPQQLVEEVASRVHQVFHYYAVRILLMEHDELVPYALRTTDASTAIDPERTISLEEVQEIALALKRDEPVHLDIRSARWGEIIPSQLSGAQAVVFIPLSIVSEVIGIMEIYAQTPQALGPEDVDVLQVLAAQIAISVVNARLFNEIRSHAVELESRVEQRTQELQSQKERTEAILRSVADAILVLDMSGEVVMTNPPGQELLDADHGDALHESVRQLFVAEGVVQSSIEIGQVTYQALASPVEFEGQMKGIVVVLRDITTLKELDQLKNQFVATVSHELRTPLTNIKLYISLLRSADEEKRGRYHKVLIRETERLSDMIEDLLNLSRLEAQRVIDKEEVALVSLLQLVADNHEPACVNKGIKFSTDFSHHVLIMADRAQIIQVFTNLLANAIAYTPVGGEIKLSIVGTEEIESQHYVKIVLSDTGIGIRKEDLPHVFDRFYRGAGAQNYQAEGSGLGLAIVREILDNHDAKVAVDSRPGEGTKFTLWLPALGK
jgi:two-component system sensor histidine kinase ResE